MYPTRAKFASQEALADATYLDVIYNTLGGGPRANKVRNVGSLEG